MPPYSPYLVFGKVTKQVGSSAYLSNLRFNTSIGVINAVTNINGLFVLDLASKGYVDGETVVFTATDRYNNEVYSGSFVVSGSMLNLNITLAERELGVGITGYTVKSMIHTVGNEPVTKSNPLPVQINDGNGNNIESHEDVDGEHYLGVAAIQAVHSDPNNSSSTNLTSANSYTFTGTATSTLGVVGLQWSLKTDQNATVYIDQSPDGTNWDITDSIDYFYSKGGDGGTVQAVNSYWRIRVVLTGTTDTTYFRLQGVLCPCVEALPRSLDARGNLKTAGCIVDCETGTRAEVEPLGALKVSETVRLVGTVFDGTTKDTNFWTEAVVGTGSVTQSGEVILATGTTANSTVSYASVRKGRKVTGAPNQFRTVCRFSTADADNVRRIGAYDVNDGYFFQLNGTTFGIGSRKATVDTIVNSGSFNGNLGATYTLGTSFVRLTITYTALSAKFFVNDILLHTVSATTDSNTSTNTLKITIENNNSNDNVTNNTLTVLFATILRIGKLETNSQYYHISGNAATHILKYGAGVLQKIIFNNTSGTSITIYDNTSAAAPIVGIITTASAALGEWEYNVPFSNGLTLVTVGNSLDATIIYE